MSDSDAIEIVAHSPIEVEWTGGQRFSGGRVAGPKAAVDGDGQVGPSPLDLLLTAIATCAATDVVIILEKQRTPADSLSIRVDSTRLATTPRRLASVLLTFTVRGAGIKREKAQRAIDLSVDKYCSVRSSLLAEIAVKTALVLLE